VELRTDEGEAWGRLVELYGSGALLSTQARLFAGDRLAVSFEAAGEAFEEFSCRVLRCEKDEDGFHLAELLWTDEVHRKRLARALADLLSR
jgi:hypothetical protein